MTGTPEPARAPGWYRTAWGRARYWDGRRWRRSWPRWLLVAAVAVAAGAIGVGGRALWRHAQDWGTGPPPAPPTTVADPIRTLRLVWPGPGDAIGFTYRSSGGGARAASQGTFDAAGGYDVVLDSQPPDGVATRTGLRRVGDRAWTAVTGPAVGRVPPGIDWIELEDAPELTLAEVAPVVTPDGTVVTGLATVPARPVADGTYAVVGPEGADWALLVRVDATGRVLAVELTGPDTEQLLELRWDAPTVTAPDPGTVMGAEQAPDAATPTTGG